MGFLRDYLDATRKALKGELPPVDPSQLTPKQRERYERNLERIERGKAQSRAANAQWKADQQATAILYGPALAHDETDWIDEAERRGGLDVARQMAAQQARGFADALGETAEQVFTGVPEPDAAAAAAELAARTAARVPYRAPEAPPVVVTRLATRGATQLEELIAHLRASGLAARPDLVHGVFRVPDRISPNVTPHTEAGRVVEWAVVRHPAAPAPSAEPVEMVTFPREARLLARGLGEPSVIDEEVGALYCGLAGLPAEACFGIARLPAFLGPTTGVAAEHADLEARVAGVAVLHRPVPGAAAALERFAQAPLTDPIPLVHHEVLDWEAVRDRVQPERRHAPPAPSPLPHLPSSPEELLLAYLEVVGVRAHDAYGAQVTIHTPRRHSFAGTFGDPLGPRLPTADGKPRRRLHCAEQVVISYRDRPEYAAGRERWAAYQREVLFARLDHLTSARPPLRERGRVERLIDAANVIADPLWAVESLLEDRRDPSPFPYCWPPVHK